MAEQTDKDGNNEDEGGKKQQPEAVLDEGGEGLPPKPTAEAAGGDDDDDDKAAAPGGEAGGKSLGKFQITHYTFALESDPKHANSPKVSAPGLPADKKYRQSFLGSPYGIKMQGTGLADDGNYIMYVGGKYKYGVGGAAGKPVPWKTCAVDPKVIKLGSKLQIDIYKGKGIFTGNDTGGAIKGKHIDVFAGPVPISVAYSLGTKYSEVRLLDATASDKPAKDKDKDQTGGTGTSTGTGTGKKPGAGEQKKGHLTASVGRGGTNKDADVRAVQQRLIERGIGTVGAVDGDCGPKTIAAIESFQRTFWSSPDGLIEPGKNTEKKLFEENGKVATPEKPKDKAGSEDKQQQSGDSGSGSKDKGSGQIEAGDDKKEKKQESVPADWEAISKNFSSGIPGSTYFKWHEALWLPSWGRHVKPSDVTNTSLATVLANIQKQAAALDKVREKVGKAIVVHCWLRPPAYNKQIGGASNSAHLRGMATDFHVEGMSAEAVRKIVKSTPGLYPGAGENNVSWVHLDLEHKAWFNP